MRGLTLVEIWRQYRTDRAGSIFWTTAIITILVITVSSFLIVRFESISPEAEITTSLDALWWAIVTVSTVGYGDMVPVTENGRILGSILITSGVMLVSVLTSFVTTSVMTRSDYENDQSNENIIKGIEDLNARLDRIEKMLNNDVLHN